MQPLFAIRNKISGYYLPEPAGRMGRGGSHVEPVNCAMGLQNPRLFQSKLSAQRALTAWLMGKHTADMDYEYNEFTGGVFHYQAGVNIEPVPTRKKEDWEIVSFQLILEEGNV